MVKGKKIAVFCASSHQIDDIYTREAWKLGELFVQNEMHVLYGGGAKGLMGAVADAVLSKQGKITGIIPHFMVQLEWQHPGVNEMVKVHTMAERKHLLSKGVDGVVVLPGGIGTFEEALEVLSLKKLGQFFAPIVFMNTKQFYNPLFQLLEQAADEKFMRQMHKNLWEVADTAEDVIRLLNTVEPWPENSIDFADMPSESSQS